MKKTILTLFVLLAFAIPNVANAQDSVLTVSASATETVSPDVANVTFSVETQGKTAQIASEQNRINSQKLYDYLNGVINKKNGDSIKTTAFNISPMYKYENKEQKLYGYKAQNTVSIKTKNIKNIGKIISESLEKGANKVQNVQFSIDEDAYYYSVLEKASKNAKEQAQTVAKSLGVNICGIKSVSSSYNSSFISPYNYRTYDSMEAGMMKAEAAPAPIEAGDIKISGSVNIEFYLECACPKPCPKK